MRPDALIFTKDRPAQLDLLTRSILHFAPWSFTSVTVCGARHNFDVRLRKWLDAKERSEMICWLVDDDVFVNHAPFTFIGHSPTSMRFGDYDYPLSLDGCVYATTELRGLLHSFSFANPTELEAGMDARRDRWPHHAFYKHPCLVGIPHNRVSESSNMPTMGGSAAELNERFHAGEQISLDAIVAAVDPAGGAHQAIVYQWEPRS